MIFNSLEYIFDGIWRLIWSSRCDIWLFLRLFLRMIELVSMAWVLFVCSKTLFLKMTHKLWNVHVLVDLVHWVRLSTASLFVEIGGGSLRAWSWVNTHVLHVDEHIIQIDVQIADVDLCVLVVLFAAVLVWTRVFFIGSAGSLYAFLILLLLRVGPGPLLTVNLIVFRGVLLFVRKRLNWDI